MTPKGLLLYPGSGGNKDNETLVALEDRLELPVRRMNFDYREQNPGPRPPPRIPVLVAEVGEVIDRLCHEWEIEPGELILGGRSMGGRVVSVAHAQGIECAGLVLLSYPLHPPRKPEKLRVDHFGDIEAPVLLVHGTKDPFGTRDDLERHFAEIGPETRLVWLERAGHQPKDHSEAICESVSAWIEDLSQ